MASGAAGAFIVLTVATGGTSPVVLGFAADDVTGWGAEKAYDIIEDKVN